MPQFTYTGDEGRYYPTLGLAPVPGETYDLPKDPGDGRWDAAKTQTKKSAGRAPEKEGSDA
ncbi:MAG TPA: hypothetical protein VN088_17120 [Nocardioides sp.]|nr:hypothetical protein [Nocardioides sp.]